MTVSSVNTLERGKMQELITKCEGSLNRALQERIATVLQESPMRMATRQADEKDLFFGAVARLIDTDRFRYRNKEELTILALILFPFLRQIIANTNVEDREIVMTIISSIHPDERMEVIQLALGVMSGLRVGSGEVRNLLEVIAAINHRERKKRVREAMNDINRIYPVCPDFIEQVTLYLRIIVIDHDVDPDCKEKDNPVLFNPLQPVLS